jgi:hypothetical protein
MAQETAASFLGRGLKRLVRTVLLIVVGVVGLTVLVQVSDCLKKREQAEQRAAAQEKAAAEQALVPDAPGKPVLPDATFKGGAVLGQSRAGVQRLLGKPAEHTDAGDAYDVGSVRVVIVYPPHKNRATGFAAAIKNGASDPVAVRKWLGIPETDPIMVGGREYTIEFLADAVMVGDKQIAKEAEEAEAKEKGRKGREEYAQVFEKLMLDERMDARVRASGDDKKTLYITCALCSRVLLNEMFVKSTKANDQVRHLGFVKIVCDTGYDEVDSLSLK